MGPARRREGGEGWVLTWVRGLRDSAMLWERVPEKARALRSCICLRLDWQLLVDWRSQDALQTVEVTHALGDTYISTVV